MISTERLSSYKGKIIGLILGLMFNGLPGAFLGFILGHLYDDQRNSVHVVRHRQHDPWADAMSQPNLADTLERATYTIGVIVLGAKMAKTDGRVSRAEIAAFKKVFHIHESQTAKIGEIFDSARQTAEGFEPYALRLAKVFRRNPVILEEILTGLFIIAASDSMGLLSPAEARFLGKVAFLFEFSQADFIRIAARSGVRLPEQPEISKSKADENYVVLGLPENAAPELIKKTYHALIRKHHPDRLASQGLPPELIEQATEKMKRINAAYDAICRAKGIK